jgi:hypothetical protein
MTLARSEVQCEAARRAGALTNLAVAVAGLSLDRHLPGRYHGDRRGLRRQWLGGTASGCGKRDGGKSYPEAHRYSSCVNYYGSLAALDGRSTN